MKRQIVWMALVLLGGWAGGCSGSIGSGQDAGEDATADAGVDAGSDPGADRGNDAGADPGADPGVDAGADAGADPGADPGADAGMDAGADPGADTGGVDPVGELAGTIRVDHFGWRTDDEKIALVLGHAGEECELRRTADNSIAGTFVAGALVDDEDSGDRLAPVDFSAVTEPGSYYLYLPVTGERSYPFAIADDVYDVVGAAVVKSFYFQRCNHDKALPYASDALPGHAGLGAEWVDAACHTGDAAATAGPGSPDHGPLDLHGGWHDAGDYQKTLWGRGVPAMLFAWEVNPAAWPDGQLNIPESGNGVPDLLDEIGWELDFYLRMQRPDGHFITSVKGRTAEVASPPSASDEVRVYFDSVAPSGDGWSGGGTTIAEASGNAVLCLAHAAIVYREAGQASTGDGYAAAAAAGWAWLDAATPASDRERRLKAAAAAAVARMDGSIASARAHAAAFDWETWDGLAPWSVTPSESVIAAGAWHVLSDPGASAQLADDVRAGVQAAIVDRAFQQADPYGGMFGDSSDGWDWSWGSNRQQATYGANLFMAARFGITGDHGEDAVRALAGRHLHYLLGRNPLNMVYLTNMAAYGGEHASYQIYHSWFSHTAGDGDHGNELYNGLPRRVVEPLYPYHPDDDQTSEFGPAPGLVPGGANWYYGCGYDIPGRAYPAYAYRDFSVGCDWDGNACTACAWEITEPMCDYQGPLVLLLSFVMGG